MFVSDRLNISEDDDHMEDDDDIDEHDNPSNGYGPPAASKKKKNKTMMLILLKRKKKKKENISSRESCDDAATSDNINVSKPNKVVLFPFIKSNKLFHKKGTPSTSNTPAAVASNADCFPGNASTSCFCFKQPPTLESSSTSAALESQTSDPNDPNFTFDMLKYLIETNDFFSKECNTHCLDAATTS